MKDNIILISLILLMAGLGGLLVISIVGASFGITVATLSPLLASTFSLLLFAIVGMISISIVEAL